MVPVKVGIWHIGFKHPVNLFHPCLQRAFQWNIRNPARIQIGDDLPMKHMPLLISAAIPGVVVGNVVLAQEKEIVAAGVVVRNPGQERRRATMVVERKHVGGDRVGVDETVTVRCQNRLFLTLQMTDGNLVERLKRDPPVHLMFRPVFPAVFGGECGVVAFGKRFGDRAFAGGHRADEDHFYDQIPVDRIAEKLPAAERIFPDLRRGDRNGGPGFIDPAIHRMQRSADVFAVEFAAIEVGDLPVAEKRQNVILVLLLDLRRVAAALRSVPCFKHLDLRIECADPVCPD